MHLYAVQGTKTDFFSNDTLTNKMVVSNIGLLTAVQDQEFTIGLGTFDSTQRVPIRKFAAAKNKSVFYIYNNTVVLAGTTDNNGKLKVTLTEPGEYLFYSQSGDVQTAPAACIVRVLEKKLLIDTLQLSLSEAGENLLTDFSSEKTEYTITVPDKANSLYGRVGVNAESGTLNWYPEYSVDGTSWSVANRNDASELDGSTATSFALASNASTIKIYVNDESLQSAKNAPISREYIIKILRQVQLTGLETSGTTLSDADFTTGKLDVYVAHSAATATLTPTAVEGDTILVNGESATSGQPVTVNLDESGTTAVSIAVHREGDSYVASNYTVTFHAASSDATPVFRENLSTELTEYLVGDGNNYVKPMTVYADANGEVSYQWYSNTVPSTEGGTAIEGAATHTFSPPTDTSGELYYYCVATNGNTTTASNVAHIRIHERSTLKWEMNIPALPTDKADLFGEHTQGFYYQKGDTAVTPLTVSLELPESLSNQAEVKWYNWSTPGVSGANTTAPSYTPDTGVAYGGKEWRCSAHLSLGFADRDISIDTVSGVYIYVDRGVSTPSESETAAAWTGSGTKASPWELASQADLVKLAEFVSHGYDFTGAYFLMVNDIALDSTWTSIGTGDDGSKGADWAPFSGALDGGNHTLSYTENTDQPLFKYVREATVQNLTIHAPHIKNYGLVSNYTIDYGDDGVYSVGTGGSYAPGCPDTIDIINVTIKTGSVIEKSGFIGGFASGGNTVNILNCTVENNVKIGWNGTAPIDAANIGSFAGWFNGTMANCVSYADVYGSSFVGGLAGQKGQSMGQYEFTNCAFLGTVTATGRCAGGIAGGGYTAGSAPNTPGATIRNCYVSGSITGSDYVGGIYGGEVSQIQAWGKSYIRNNCFYGTVQATAEDGYAGGIIGRMNSLNANNVVENNYYVADCGAENGIGFIRYLDTSAAVSTPGSTTVFNTGSKLPGIMGVSKEDMNRTDNPLGEDAAKLTDSKPLEKFKDGTVAQLLNEPASSLRNWTVGESGPIHSKEPVIYKLNISGDYKTSYTLGEELDLSGAIFTATRSDGITSNVALDEIEVSGYDKNTRSVQTLTAKYGLVSCEFTVTVLKAEAGGTPNTIKVYFTLLGDKIHDTNAGVHTLNRGNLETWISRTAYNVNLNATVKDVFEYALTENHMTWSNPTGNYVESITANSVELAEFTNGELTGWMYTLNGHHSELGVAEQFLEDGDVIVFHYTDDYTAEEGSQNRGGGIAIPETAMDKVEKLIEAIGTVTKDNGDAIKTAREAYDALSAAQKKLVSNYGVLVEAEAKYAELIDQKELAFTDVSEAAYYYEAVKWAVEQGITNGTSETTFSPDASCTRAQMVTFLWRAAGSPEATLTTHTFTDVDEDVYYYEALLWAIETGLTNGTSATTFIPDAVCTRGQMATFLYRNEKSPAVDSQHPFTDVKETAYYNDAVTWAANEGITVGTAPNTFSPDAVCTRGQMVTFLFRYLAE